METSRDLHIGYELNPPRILSIDPTEDNSFDEDLNLFLSRAEKVSRIADRLHLTDSVLGVPRISSTVAASLIRSKIDRKLQLICNVRTSDHNLNGIIQMIGEAKAVGVAGITLLKGDAPKHGEPTSTTPLGALTYLRKQGFTKKDIKFYLTVPANISTDALNDKLAAEPDGIVTQPVADIKNFEVIADYLKSQGIEVVASIMVPSEKNIRSAKLIGVDWTSYEKDVASFVRKVGAKASEVLLSSPNNFEAGLTLASKL